ncbi:MAG: hypothetical protein ACYC3X_26605 [Pirellulaceae bacterium]
MNALRRFLELAVSQHEAIETALRNDKRCEETQQRLTDWHQGNFELRKHAAPSGAVWETGAEFSPAGETKRLLNMWSGRTSPSEFAAAYEAATAEAWQEGRAFTIPLIRQLLDAHEAMLVEASRRYEESSAELSDSSDEHCRVASVLVDLLNAVGGTNDQLLATDTPNAPAVELNTSQQAIVDLLRTTGHRLTTTGILDGLSAAGLVVSEGMTKQTLAVLGQFGILTNSKSAKPPGYGLPEWEQS